MTESHLLLLVGLACGLAGALAGAVLMACVFRTRTSAKALPPAEASVPVADMGQHAELLIARLEASCLTHRHEQLGELTRVTQLACQEMRDVQAATHLNIERALDLQLAVVAEQRKLHTGQLAEMRHLSAQAWQRAAPASANRASGRAFEKTDVAPLASAPAELAPPPTQPPAQTPTPTRTTEPQRSKVASPPPPKAAVTARPPELLHTPIVQPSPDYAPEILAPELTDEELDALPPDLPVADKVVKRLQSAPKKPVLRQV